MELLSSKTKVASQCPTFNESTSILTLHNQQEIFMAGSPSSWHCPQLGQLRLRSIDSFATALFHSVNIKRFPNPLTIANWLV